MSQSAEQQPNNEANVTPVDGGTLTPPVAPPEASQVTLQSLSSADSRFSDTSHVQQLISHGADVNAPDNNGWTPLHTAAYHGQEEIVRILLAANANVNARNKTQETPLHLASKWPQDRVVEALLSGGADLAARNKRGRTPAHVAAIFNRHAILDRLLNAGADVNALDNDHQTPLHLAVRDNNPVEPELVKTLIRHGADLGARDVRGVAPLHFLPCAQDWLHWAAYEGKEELMRELLAKPSIRPDCYSDEGLTPLHLAAHGNSISMVTMLLNAGAKVNAPSQPPSKSSGRGKELYGIHLPGAPGSITGGISISTQIKAYGSSKLPPGELTALHIAAERGSAELIRVLVAAGAKVNVQGERGMPPLHVAVWEGNTAAVVSLLAAKASVSLKSKAGGFTSVHCACLSSRATPELLALLLDNGGAAVIEERCQEGWTALHLACQAAPPAMVELLLQRGARATAKGKNGRTAADCAAKRPEILQILHVATGGKVPLPLGLGLPSVAAAAAANGLLAAAANGHGGGSSGGAGGSGSRSSGGAAAAAAAAGGSGNRSGRVSGAASGGSGSGSTGGSSSSARTSSAGLLPGTAAVLEPLENVEATLAALLADMGGALCSLQAGGVFGAGACTVDPVGHCIRPLDKRLVMVCTLGCQFSFHLQCWKSAREVLKERWAGFTGKLEANDRYCCIAPRCPGFIREQAICDGTQMQASHQSRLYFMAQDVYTSLPPQAKPIGGGVPPPPGAGDGCISGGSQQPAIPVQPALPAGGGLSSLAALNPSLSLAQAMVQAATAVGNMVGGSGRIGSSHLAAALAATGGLPALLAHTPPIPTCMSAREAAAIAAETLGVSLGSGSSCVVEELGSSDDFDDDEFLGPLPPPASSRAGGASGSTSASGRAGSGGSGGSASARSGGAASANLGSGASANGGASRKHGGSSGGGSLSSRRGGKGGGGKSMGGKSPSSVPPISSAAAAEMLQQLQGLQQAVAAVQSAVGGGSHSTGGLGSGAGGTARGSGGGGAAGGGADVDAGASGSAASGSSSAAAAARAPLEPTTVLEPPKDLLPLAPLDPAACMVDAGEGSGELPSGGGDGDMQGVAPMPPPKRRNTPMPPNPRRLPQPLSGAALEHGRQPVSPQLATPPPATSLLTPGVQQLLAPVGGTAGGHGAPPPRQPDASLAPILVGPVLQPLATGGPATPSATAATAAGKTVGKAPSSPLKGSASSGAGAASGSVDAASASTGEPGAAPSCGSPTRTSPCCDTAAAKGKPVNVAAAPPPLLPPSPPMSPSQSANGSPATAAAAAASSSSSPEAPSRAPAAGAAPCSPCAGAASTTRGGMSKSLGRSGAASPRAQDSQGAHAQSLPCVIVLGGCPNSSRLLSPQQAAVALNAGSYEPGGYARAVCPGLRPGVHRVTLSSSGSPPRVATSPSGDGGSESPAEFESPSAGDAAACSEEGDGEGVVVPAAALEGKAAGQAANGNGEQGSGRGPIAAAAPAGPLLESARGGSSAASATATGASAGSADIIKEALRSMAVTGAAGGSEAPRPAAAAAAAPSRHLVLQSGDIPLLAGTPGMLEAWLSAHVGNHGRLAAYRIMAPQAAVAVSLDSDAAAAAALGSLRGRPTLLVQPLAVAPLRDFPEDEVLATYAQQVAREGCLPGDRSWMRSMVDLWERLQSLPPVVRDA